MKKSIVLLALTVLFVFNAQADNSIASSIKRLQKIVDVGTNGGDTYLYEYDVKNFDFSEEIKSVYGEIRDTGCSYVVVKSRRELKNDITTFASFIDSEEAQKIVQRLIDNQKLKAVVGYYWDGVEGDSEYCSKEELTLYFINGKVLKIDYDSTT